MNPTTTTRHPIHAWNDGVINTLSGALINLKDPDPATIRIGDIASALSKIPRFGGHAVASYSVAQHSVVMARLAPPEYRLYALLHDAAEAYLGDVVKPLKVLLGEAYTSLEERFDKTIAQTFNLEWTDAARAYIKEADAHLLEVEHKALQCYEIQPLLSVMRLAHFEDNGWAWRPELAERTFGEDYNLYASTHPFWLQDTGA